MSKSDLGKLQSGEVSSEFNSSIAILLRLDYLLKQANYYSGQRNMEGVARWFDACRAIDRELSPLLNAKQEAELGKVRINEVDLNKNVVGQIKVSLIMIMQQKLDKYERVLRKYMFEKGLGIKASSDLSSVML